MLDAWEKTRGRRPGTDDGNGEHHAPQRPWSPGAAEFVQAFDSGGYPFLEEGGVTSP